jgi:hypothetical protein
VGDARVIGSQRTITTVVGPGQKGFTNDYAPAIEAQHALPEAVARDAHVTPHIADIGKDPILHVSVNGTTTSLSIE